MPRIDPLPRETLGDLNVVITAAENRMGFIPNSQLILARRPRFCVPLPSWAPRSTGRPPQSARSCVT